VTFPGGACSNSQSCAKGETRITLDEFGGPDKNGNTHNCKYPVPQQMGATPWYDAELALCCNSNGLSLDTINLPVPLADLFPKPGPESDTEKLDIQLDKTVGGQIDAGNSINPDDHPFGFYIMSGQCPTLPLLQSKLSLHHTRSGR
jgi:chitinase